MHERGHTGVAACWSQFTFSCSFLFFLALSTFMAPAHVATSHSEVLAASTQVGSLPQRPHGNLLNKGICKSIAMQQHKQLRDVFTSCVLERVLLCKSGKAQYTISAFVVNWLSLRCRGHWGYNFYDLQYDRLCFNYSKLWLAEPCYQPLCDRWESKSSSAET